MPPSPRTKTNVFEEPDLLRGCGWVYTLHRMFRRYGRLKKKPKKTLFLQCGFLGFENWDIHRFIGLERRNFGMRKGCFSNVAFLGFVGFVGFCRIFRVLALILGMYLLKTLICHSSLEQNVSLSSNFCGPLWLNLGLCPSQLRQILPISRLLHQQIQLLQTHLHA